MDEKNIIAARQRKTVVSILAFSAMILFFIGCFIKDRETGSTLQIMGCVLILATFFMVFKLKIGYKPTEEEIEERMFGKK